MRAVYLALIWAIIFFAGFMDVQSREKDPQKLELYMSLPDDKHCFEIYLTRPTGILSIPESHKFWACYAD